MSSYVHAIMVWYILRFMKAKYFFVIDMILDLQNLFNSPSRAKLFEGTGPIRGSLTVTNYRLYFRPQQRDNPIILGEKTLWI